MNFDYSEKTLALRAALERFMDERIYPNKQTYRLVVHEAENRRSTPALMHDLRAEAKAVNGL